MIKVKANDSVRNLADNALVGITLAKDSVFFGINGSGKSTVCEVLSTASKLEQLEPNNRGELIVYAFDEKWRKAKVGDFVEGGSAKGVTTVRLNEGAGELDEQIKKAKAALEKAEAEEKREGERLEQAQEKLDGVIEKVFKGFRKELEGRCSDLNGRRFNRAAIRRVLESVDCKELSEEEIDKRISLVSADGPGYIPDLPSIPEYWEFTDGLWEEIANIHPRIHKLSILLNDWVREGRKNHESGEKCQFCGAIVTDERLDAIDRAIRQAESEASLVVRDELDLVSAATENWRNFKSALEQADFSQSAYGEKLTTIKFEVLYELSSFIDALEGASRLLDEQVRNSQEILEAEKPSVDPAELREVIGTLYRVHSEINKQASKHSDNQELALDELKQHCCAKDGSGWSSADGEFKAAKSEHDTAQRNSIYAKKELADLKKKVSTTAFTAKFLDNNLGMIMGEKTLRVEQGEEGEGYRITRHSLKADGLSEGEKKLISLLYFCAEFLADERRERLANSIVMFDDLGSELDEARLMAVDRFISNHFTDPKPAALVYFTHSHSYLRILQSRLSKNVIGKNKNGCLEAPKAKFFEIYKDSFSDERQNTRWREWPPEQARLTNDYWLSFYVVLKAFEDLRRDVPPALSTGNFCRKVLEGFTEFKEPCNDSFGSRIESILAKKEILLSPAVSKIVNELSHSQLSKAGGVLSRNETELAIVQTLNFMYQVDDEHLDKLLRRFRNAQQVEDLIRDLSRRVDAGRVDAG
ncbi:AAA family ATPase [Corynebacterium sp. H78]|uniref:AAA family ATPase n=1 Tax=Corynebacterium sp. H78 TaxID=3133417 RepID=UPI0030B4C5C9